MIIKSKITKKKISPKIFKKVFLKKNQKLSLKMTRILNKSNLTYAIASKEEIYDHVNFILKNLFSNKYWISGSTKKKKWDWGWNFNLKKILKTKKIFPSLIPYFYTTKSLIRFDDTLIKPNINLFELKLFSIYRDMIFEKYLKKFNSIYEFGCGSCHNILAIEKMFPKKTIFGLDWSDSSKKICNELNTKHNKNLKFIKFNMFNPKSLKLKKNSAIITIGALEQTGSKFKKLVDKLIEQKVGIVISMESIVELYNKDILLENLAYYHDIKRNYLNGYLTYLKKLEKRKKIQILNIKKIKFGGPTHDSYSTIIWKVDN